MNSVLAFSILNTSIIPDGGEAELADEASHTCTYVETILPSMYPPSTFSLLTCGGDGYAHQDDVSIMWGELSEWVTSKNHGTHPG